MALQCEVDLVRGGGVEARYSGGCVCLSERAASVEALLASVVHTTTLRLPGAAHAVSAQEYSSIASGHQALHATTGLDALLAAVVPVPSSSPRATRQGFVVGASLLPELAWVDPARPGVVLCAEGEGVLRHAVTGAVVYSGSFSQGARHGAGRGTLLRPSGEVLGVYEGEWVYGLRHGRGTLHDEAGPGRYDGAWALDRKHGVGSEVVPGGCLYSGPFVRGQRHGCGLFTWPSGRSEVREYVDGALVATRTDAGLLSPPPSPVVSRVASTHALSTHALSTHVLDAVEATVVEGQEGGRNSPGGRLVVLDVEAVSAPPPPPDAVPPTYEEGEQGGAVVAVVAVPPPLSAPPGGGGGGVHFAVRLPGAPSSSVILQLNAGVVQLLKHATVSDLPPRKGAVLTVDSSDRLETAVTRMTEHNVLSLPVRDPASGKYTAVVHLLDVCAFLLDLVAKKAATFSPVSGGLRETLAHQKRFAQSPVSEVLEMSSHLTPTHFRPLPSGCPLIFAAQTLAGGGVHAVPIVDAEGTIVRLLTQGDVIRFLAGNVDELGPLGQLTLGQLLPDMGKPGGEGCGPAPLIVAGLRDRAMDVLARMRRSGAPAAAVVDSYGSMVANLSFSDVKSVARRANFSALAMPVQAFLSALERGSEVMKPNIVARASTPLSSVLLTLAATRIHQLYFVDEQLHPVAAIRTGDVLRLLVGASGEEGQGA